MTDKWTKFRRARENIANWPNVVLFTLPIIKKTKLYFRPVNYQHVVSVYRNPISISKDDGIISFGYEDKTIKFYFDGLDQLGNSGLLIKGAFFDKEYEKLDPTNEVVIDIGGNVGDTAIYFALEGARMVYMFEPYPYSCRIAAKNVALNNMLDKIQIINAACGGESKTITIDPNFRNDGASEIIQSTNGVQIKQYTLDDIIREFNITDYVLKIDCEGAEDQIIKNASDSALNMCKKFIMESTSPNREEIINRLKNLGFKISISDEHNVIVYAEK